MLLRYLETITLKKNIKTKQPNGSYVESYEAIKDYKVQKKELNDEVSASVYGASLINMLRIKTPLGDLEYFLSSKLNNEKDNISQYSIFYKERKYRIKSVNSKGIDIELI